jgi:ketosteroid isomerase-like protein
MNDEDLDILRRGYEAINAIDAADGSFVDPEGVAPELWARLAPDFELHERTDLPDARVYRGPDEAKEFWRKTQQVFSEIRWQPRELIDLGDAVVAPSRITATGRGSDARIEVDETAVFWFRDGLMVRLQAFPTLEEGLAAARSERG